MSSQYRKFLSLFILFFSAFNPIFSQDTISKPSLQQANTDTALGTDAFEIFNIILHPNKIIDSTVLKKKQSRKYQVSIVPGLGYTLQSSYVANISGNVVYRNGLNDSTSISAMVGGIAYTANKQLLFYVQSNLWSKNNQWNIINDIRYYQYPQNSYGLGGYTANNDAFLVDYSFLRFYGTAYKKMANQFYFGVGYMLDTRWNITQDRTSITDFDRYGFKSKSTSSGFSLNVLSDTRDNPVNTLKGYFANAFIRFNNRFIGSDDNWTAMVIDLRKFVKVGHKKNVFAFWNYNWLTLNGNAPYLDLPSTAWDPFNNMGRGYIQSRFRSPNLIYLESEFRFNISKNQLIGGVLFANAQTYSQYPTNKFEKVLPGFGTGIRIKFNKYSRTNLAIDYGMALDGSGGIFLNLGEVF
jgi:hypothetical protein